jgi:hypothetical protein
MLGWVSGIHYKAQDGATCLSEPYAKGACIFEIPEIGYLNVRVNPRGPDTSYVYIRLAPNPGVEVRWASTDVVVIDLDKGNSENKGVLPATSLLGQQDIQSHITGYLRTLYGPYFEAEFVLKPLISHVELRLPNILSSVKVARVPRVQYDDGVRIPVPIIPPVSH